MNANVWSTKQLTINPNATSYYLPTKHICAKEWCCQWKKNGHYQFCTNTAYYNIFWTATCTNSCRFAGVFLIKKLQNFLSLSARTVMSLATHEHLSQSRAGGGGACASLRPRPVQFSEQDWTALNNGWKLKKSYKETLNLTRFCVENVQQSRTYTTARY